MNQSHFDRIAKVFADRKRSRRQAVVQDAARRLSTAPPPHTVLVRMGTPLPPL